MIKYKIIALIIILSIFSCEDNPNKNDYSPTLSVLYPNNDSIVKDSITISLEIQDENNVLKIELWLNGDSTDITDYNAPFSLELNTKNYNNGPSILFVRLYNKDGEIHDSEDINFIINNFLVFNSRFGSSEKNESGHSILQKADSNFVVLGSIDNDILLLESNNKGQVLWSQSYGGSQMDEAHHFEQTSDGGYIISGSTNSYGFGGSDIWLIKTGEDGLIEWNSYLGTNNDEKGGQVLETADNGFIIIGNYINDQNSDVWLIKTNSQGDTLWTKTYDDNRDEIGTDIILEEDGGYVILGSTTSSGNEESDILIIKINSLGTKEWSQNYGIGSNDIGQAILKSSDGGYLIQFLVEGYGSGNTAVGLLKIDSQGNVLWTKAFGGSINTKSRMFSQINNYEYISACSQIDYSTNSSHAWLIKINDNGEILWEKLFGKDGIDKSFSAIPTLDNGFAITGKTNSYENNHEEFFDLWILKTDSEGFSKLD